MKGKKFYIALIGLFIIGISSIYFYRQQEEARALEFEGYEISSIENRVDALYNAEKTDIQEEIEPKFKELEEIFDELRTKNLRYRNEKQVEELEKQFLTAKEMHDLQIEIGKIFKADDIVRDTISLDNIEALETSLASFEDKTVYFKRNSHYISDARVQLETLEEATKQVEALTSDETPIEEVDEEELEKLEELVAQIKDEKKKENLLEQIEAVRTALAEIETEAEVALEETDEMVEEEPEVEETLEDEEAAEAVEEETEAGIEEAVEEESVETVQETAQATEQPNNTTPPTNDSESNTQQASSNNNRANTSQTNRSSSNSSTNGSSSNQPSTPAKQETNQQTNNQTKKQTNKQENNQQESQQSKGESQQIKQESQPNKEATNEEKKETKAVEERPAVSRKYTETNVEDTTPFETLTYRNANITAGEEIVYREGRPGQIIETYEITEYKNGTSSKRLISSEETEPENRVITIGTKEPETEEE